MVRVVVVPVVDRAVGVVFQIMLVYMQEVAGVDRVAVPAVILRPNKPVADMVVLQL